MLNLEVQLQVVQPVPLVHRYTGGFFVQFGSVRQVYPFVLSNPFVMDVFGYRYFSYQVFRRDHPILTMRGTVDNTIITDADPWLSERDFLEDIFSEMAETIKKIVVEWTKASQSSTPGMLATDVQLLQVLAQSEYVIGGAEKAIPIDPEYYGVLQKLLTT